MAFKLQIIESDGDDEPAPDQGELRSAMRTAIRIGLRITVYFFLWLTWMATVA